MKSTMFLILLLSACANEPLSFQGESDSDDNDSGNPDSGSDSDNDSDSDSDSDSDTDPDSDTGSETDVDGGTDGDTDSDGDTETETETSSDTATETDSDSDTGTESDTESGGDTETDSDTETETETVTDTETDNACPWECASISEASDLWHVCDDFPEDPDVIQNWNFDCSADEYCCQPLDAGAEPGALSEYCLDQGYQCTDVNVCKETDRKNEYYCNASGKVCCAW